MDNFIVIFIIFSKLYMCSTWTITEGTSFYHQDTCSISEDPGDLASSMINDIYSSVKKSECQLANPSDYPAHYSPHEGEDFDFIIVGSGSAGAVIANRLTEENSWRVLLLEAGGYPTKTTEVPALYNSLQKTSVDWQYQTEPNEENCLGMMNNSCNWPRGKVLGGSSTINALLYVRGHRKNYDAWAEAGNEGWDYDSVLPYFKKSEKIEAIEILKDANYKKYHGEKGYLNIGTFMNHDIKDLGKAFSNGMEELGYKTMDDCNGESQMGFTRLQGTLVDGKRCSTAKAFLKPIKTRKNLKVSTRSLATQILIDKESKTAYGVKFVNKEGKKITVKAKKEVIVSAGAINSPQLLMLSGLGPKQHLAEFGIDVIEDLPVGENLQDHMLMVGLLYSHNYTTPPEKPITDYMYEFMVSNSSVLSGVGMLTYSSFINTLNHSSEMPDIQYHHVDFYVNDTLPLTTTLRVLGIKENIIKQYLDINSKRFITILMSTLLRPFSRGKIQLRSKNPEDRVKIISGYLSDERDVETFLRATEFLSKLAATKGLQAIDTKFHEISSPACKKYPMSSREFRVCALKHFVTTVYHPTSTCRMGPPKDFNTVVNPKLQVWGIKHLRVADASVFSSIISGNTNAAVIMIGEKASDLIKQTWLS